ncbi:ErfK-YbiS-YcfS-YnhG family protein [Lysobacter daejeonensis GH1-9]|uniref:ErfK-YbiS-YcfS-YnhG family protein n=2 Tax=Aerolutibacter TaxID=3382701 RepID=A0A0A0EYY1_9GAMM|nr:ErfK-YbiS-YcfS-YnhG family protein [Lysobacter daejeonensis GH1-9]
MAGVLAVVIAAAQASVPFWGAKTSSPADTPPAQLKAGQWFWGGDDKTLGPIAVVVSLTEQRGYVCRNGVLIGFTTVSTGKPGHETPTGVFHISQKDKDHHSSKYNNAPMPYQQRLTQDGVALHAGGLPGYPESHGCVHLPSEFARLLFGASNMGMTVVVAEEGKAPAAMVHPTALIPIDPVTGGQAVMPTLDDGQPFRWQPEQSPDGSISMVISTTDQRIVVLRNGIEIGRARIHVRDPHRRSGTHAYVASTEYMGGEVPGYPGLKMPKWTVIGIPGHGDEQGTVLDADAIHDLVMPHEFARQLAPLIVPGTVVVATDQRMLPHSTGRVQAVIDTLPPTATAAR